LLHGAITPVNLEGAEVSDDLIEIYGLFHPETKELRYIGKAKCSKRRLKSHLRDAKRRNTPVYCWINKLASQGKTPECRVLISVSEEFWKSAEIFAIETARTEGFRLLNVAFGGDEPHCSTEVRRANGIKTVRTRDKEKTRKMTFLSGALRSGHVLENTKQKMRDIPELMKTFARYL
jgi:hypothetical protein